MIATQENYENVMLTALDRIDQFRSAYTRLKKMKDGAAEAAEAILKIGTSPTR